jgi:hypothetical protein
LHRAIALIFAAAFLLAALIVEPASASIGVENTWTTKAPMQQARGHLGVAVVNGKIYAIGGSNATNAPQTDSLVGTNEEYNPATDTWVFKTPMPKAMWNFAITTYGSKIYCIGGGVNQVYDTETDTWENKTPAPAGREEPLANTLGDKIYLVGGTSNEVYEPQTDTWITRVPLPTSVANGASAVFDGKLYVFGGYVNDTLGDITQIYDPQTDAWSFGSSSPLNANYAQACVTTGINAPPKIYLFNAGIFSQPSAQMYDPDTNSWSVGVAKPTSRNWFSLAVVDDLIYAVGGLNSFEDQYVTSTIIFTPFDLNEVFTPFGYGTVHYSPSPTPVQTETPQPTVSATPIANDEQLQASAIVAVAVAVAVVVGAGLAVYLRKRRR